MCWICHQTNYLSEGGFEPCLCKGSMSFVHQSCLNSWASEQYGHQMLSRHFDPGNDVKCPNCKDSYSYNMNETMKVITFKYLQIQSFSKLRFFDSKEKITLQLLIVVQIFVLCYDLYNLATDEKRIIETIGYISKYISLSYSHFIHLGTVFILLTAAIYNLIDMVLKRTEIQILSKL